MIRGISILLILQVSAVLADPTTTPPAPTDQATQRPGFTRTPHPVPTTCDKYLPEGAERPKSQVKTLISSHIGATGSTGAVTLVQSSGSDVLDQAALRCASQIHSSPLRLDGKIIEGDEMNAVYWYPTGSTFGVASPTDRLPRCPPDEWYPVYAIRHNQQGMVTVALRVGTDGIPTNVRIAKSSGFPALDQATIDCASSWRFYPIGQNGHPVEVDKQFAINWAMF